MKVSAAMEPVEIVEVSKSKVVCEGEKGALGHPRVYLNMGDKREIDCPYCGKRFAMKEGETEAAGGH
ncbi:MAG: zinc-finger domain-containing protein [Alphaproteobacteria bacterium]|nr:zinc-finger domain-containing protein [Alphaproteobacteria bacterium]MDH5556032.1 zinc-finger domain-containing protein [Alphaproteobacteria bacterium]